MHENQEIDILSGNSSAGEVQIDENKKVVSRAVDTARALLGMSRAIVAVFVVAHAGLAAILATGRIPPLEMIITGIFACLFGTGALIGLNDLLDVDLDRRRINREAGSNELDLGSLFIHHPVAKGVISMKLGVGWVVVLSILSVFFIYRLNPGLWPIFIAVAVFVVLYSTLGMRTYWKFMAVAMAVTLGALAGWLTVKGPINTAFWLFGIWTFLWEIGGRNVPNDFNDVDEDKALGVKTIPVVFGGETAGKVVFWSLTASVLVSLPMLYLINAPLPFTAGAIAAAAYLLIAPAWGLLLDPRPEISRKLYNKSAIYPLVLLLLLMANLLILG